MWLGIKRIMPVEERVIPPTKICIIFHITRSPIQYICYWFSVSQWKSSTIWIFGANVKVYTCFFFIWGILWLYKYNWSCYCNCHCNYNIYTPIATKYRKQQKPKIKKTFVLIALQMGCSELAVKRVWYPFGVVPAHLLFLLVILLFNLWFMRQSKNFWWRITRRYVPSYPTKKMN